VIAAFIGAQLLLGCGSGGQPREHGDGERHRPARDFRLYLHRTGIPAVTPKLQKAIEILGEADGIIAATPVCKDRRRGPG
jgi:hypothetical protein